MFASQHRHNGLFVHCGAQYIHVHTCRSCSISRERKQIHSIFLLQLQFSPES